MSADEERIPGVTDVPVRVQVRDADRDSVSGAEIAGGQVCAVISGFRTAAEYDVGYGQLVTAEPIGEDGIADLGTVVDEDRFRLVENEDGSYDVKGEVPSDPDESLDESWNVITGADGRPNSGSHRYATDPSFPDPVDPLAADGNTTSINFLAKLQDDDGDTWVGSTAPTSLQYVLNRLADPSYDTDSIDVFVTNRLVDATPGLTGYTLITDRTRFGATTSNTIEDDRAIYGRVWVWQEFSTFDAPPTLNVEITGTFRHEGLRPGTRADPIEGGGTRRIERFPTVDSFGNPTQYEDALLKRGVVHVEIPDRVTVPIGEQRSGEDPLGLGNRVLPIAAVPAPRDDAEQVSAPGDSGGYIPIVPGQIAQARAIYYTLLNDSTPSGGTGPIYPLVGTTAFVPGAVLAGATGDSELLSGTQESIVGGLAGVTSAGVDAADELSGREVGRYAGMVGKGLGKASSLLTAKSLFETAAGVIDDESQAFTNSVVTSHHFDPNQDDRYTAAWDLKEKSPAVVVSAPTELDRPATVTVRAMLEKPGDPSVDLHPQFLDVFQGRYTLKPKRVPARTGGGGS